MTPLVLALLVAQTNFPDGITVPADKESTLGWVTNYSGTWTLGYGLFTSTITPIGGLSINGYRSWVDPNAVVEFNDSYERDDEAEQIRGNSGTGPARVRWVIRSQGQFFGGTPRHNPDGGEPTVPRGYAAFQDMGGLGSSLACNQGSSSCWTKIQGGINNSSFHGAVELGNGSSAPGREYRTGGLALAIHGGGNSDTYDRKVFNVDSVGNARIGGLVVTRLRTANFPPCGVGCADGGCGGSSSVPKIDFDNSASDTNDGTGSYNGVIGSFAFNYETDQLWLCTLRSWAADGGYEHIGGAL